LTTFVLSIQENQQLAMPVGVQLTRTRLSKDQVSASRNGNASRLERQWIEKLVGDMDRPGQPFVIRIHHDAGHVVLPHTHPEDENITVLTGNWALGMGSRVNIAELEPMEQGALGFVPKKMAHFGYAKVETVLQVHGDRTVCKPAHRSRILTHE
jgi:hypothetical protein